MSTTAILETIEIKLPADILRKFRDEATRRGTDADAVMTEALTERAAQIEEKPHPGMTFREIFAPVHEQVRQLGWTEEDVEAFVDAEMAAYHAEKRAAAEAG